jgi:membrane-associated phospholipid phosphatase
VEHWPTVLLGGGMGALTALAALAWQDRQAGRRRSVP